MRGIPDTPDLPRPTSPVPGHLRGQDQLADATDTVAAVLRRLRTTAQGLSQREADRRLIATGPNELSRRGGPRRQQALARQFTQPLALLLSAAVVLSLINGNGLLAAAIAAVVVLNAVLAFVQEIEAESAVEALAAFIPARALVLREGTRVEIEARSLVPGDVLLVEEGDRICADARLIEGEVSVDLSTLNGESAPVQRSAGSGSSTSSLFEATDLLFSGTTCISGEGRAVVTRTGMQTEIGRIAALSERTTQDPSPLERQVTRVARLIGIVVLGGAVAFLPLGAAAGLSIGAALSFSIGLLVANVPEGLLPTITLALGVAVRELARRGAVMKRLAAVETLGSTTVICTDKTGTLTENRMQVARVWSPDRAVDLAQVDEDLLPWDSALDRVLEAAATCTTAVMASSQTEGIGDPTELALLECAARRSTLTAEERDRRRVATFHFDPRIKLMSTLDQVGPDTARVHVKGAPESVLARCSSVAGADGGRRPPSEGELADLEVGVEAAARSGLRVLAVATRGWADDPPSLADRHLLERDLCLLGFVALLDPPRPEVADAIERAHRAGIRVHVVTGDNGLTAAEIARRVGIGAAGLRVVSGDQLEEMNEAQLDELLTTGQEIVFARSSPEAKLRITDALRALGEIVAVTGDGVNDAPALRRADIGVAMGRSGTDVAREAATMVLTDDNFATIVAAIEGGRRVYSNVRKFVVYIFAHAVPEVAPFLLFALSGGRVPLPLTVMQILAIDLGTDTLPALALSREPAEPGLMDRPPRSPHERIVQRRMLARAWGFLGVLSAALVIGGFLLTLERAGWHWGSPTGDGTPLHEAYLRATTVAWLGIVACQIGVAFAARTDRASLRQVGLFTNPALIGGIAFELIFAAAIVYVPFLHPVFGTAALSARELVGVAPYPFVVWGADELRRAYLRRGDRSP